MNTLPRAFQPFIVSILLEQIIPQVAVSRENRQGLAYRQIAASVREIGIIERLLFTRNRLTNTSCWMVTFDCRC